MSNEKRYDGVRIVNVADGTVVEGQEAVQAHFQREKELLEAHGSTLTFQVYRANLRASTIAELQGEKLAEVRVDGGYVSGTDTVAMVKDNLRPSLKGIEAADRITFYFGRRPMEDDALFYADHFVMLPAWVQVVLHTCELEELVATIRRLASPPAAP